MLRKFQILLIAFLTACGSVSDPMADLSSSPAETVKTVIRLPQLVRPIFKLNVKVEDSSGAILLSQEITDFISDGEDPEHISFTVNTPFGTNLKFKVEILVGEFAGLRGETTADFISADSEGVLVINSDFFNCAFDSTTDTRIAGESPEISHVFYEPVIFETRDYFQLSIFFASPVTPADTAVLIAIDGDSNSATGVTNVISGRSAGLGVGDFSGYDHFVLVSQPVTTTLASLRAPPNSPITLSRDDLIAMYEEGNQVLKVLFLRDVFQANYLGQDGLMNILAGSFDSEGDTVIGQDIVISDRPFVYDASNFDLVHGS